MLGDMKDPYIAISSHGPILEWQDWPNAEYPDIFNYFIATPSPYTQQQVAYKFYVDGWVSDVVALPVHPRPGAYLVTACVKHSQKLSATPAKPWVAVEKIGIAICCHCTCMAGLGKHAPILELSCSHWRPIPS